jgi:hypothetical protein
VPRNTTLVPNRAHFVWMTQLWFPTVQHWCTWKFGCLAPYVPRTRVTYVPDYAILIPAEQLWCPTEKLYNNIVQFTIAVCNFTTMLCNFTTVVCNFITSILWDTMWASSVARGCDAMLDNFGVGGGAGDQLTW